MSPHSIDPATPTDGFSSKLAVDRRWLQKLLQRHGHSTKEPLYVLAPMVDQSDLPFRLQCRKYGTQLCFTPMVHAKLFTTMIEYERRFTLSNGPAVDRPLIAQICGGNPAQVLECALKLQPYCDGIDINCGCPQGIARRGNYGAFLLEETDQLLELVSVLTRHLTVPLSVKVRLLPAATRDESVQKSLALYEQLVDAGVHMLTIHGRTRFHKGVGTGAADWEAIRAAVDLLGDRIPILANGSICSRQQADECLRITAADGVMSSEAVLEYPALFAPTDMLGGKQRIPRTALATEYLELCKQYHPDDGGQGRGVKCMRAHVHHMLHADLQERLDVRQILIDSETLEDLELVVRMVQEMHDAQENHDSEQEELTWYMRHRTLVRDESGLTINMAQHRKDKEGFVDSKELVDDTADCFACLFDSEY